MNYYSVLIWLGKYSSVCILSVYFHEILQKIIVIKYIDTIFYIKSGTKLEYLPSDPSESTDSSPKMLFTERSDINVFV